MALFEFLYDTPEKTLSESAVKQLLAVKDFELIKWQYETSTRLVVLVERHLTSYSAGRAMADVVLSALPQGSAVAGCRQSVKIQDMSQEDLQELLDALENETDAL